MERVITLLRPGQIIGCSRDLMVLVDGQTRGVLKCKDKINKVAVTVDDKPHTIILQSVHIFGITDEIECINIKGGTENESYKITAQGFGMMCANILR